MHYQYQATNVSYKYWKYQPSRLLENSCVSSRQDDQFVIFKRLSTCRRAGCSRLWSCSRELTWSWVTTARHRHVTWLTVPGLPFGPVSKAKLQETVTRSMSVRSWPRWKPASSSVSKAWLTAWLWISWLILFAPLSRIRRTYPLFWIYQTMYSHTSIAWTPATTTTADWVPAHRQPLDKPAATVQAPDILETIAKPVSVKEWTVVPVCVRWTPLWPPPSVAATERDFRDSTAKR